VALMSHLVGTDYVNRFPLLTSEGLLVTGETFVADVALAPDGSTLSYSVVELGDGFYETRIAITQSGTHYLRLLSQTIVPQQVMEFQFATDDWEVGDTITHYFTVRDDDGNFYSGATISVSGSFDPLGSPFVPIVELIGNGLYRVSWVATLSGTYSAIILADLTAIGDDPQLFELESMVDPVPEETTIFQIPVGPTLDDLVRETATKCRDYLNPRATADASDTRTWPDTSRLSARSPKTFKGASLYILSADNEDNVGLEVHILDSVDGSLVLAEDLPGAVKRGDRGYIVNLESNGFARDTYVDTLNDTIEGSFPNALQPATWTFVDVFDAEYPYLTPPDGFTHLCELIIPAGVWTTNPVYIPLGSDISAGWYWDDGVGRITLTGGYRDWAGGMLLTLNGFGPWSRLEAGTDRTGIDRQWLTEMAAGSLVISLRDPRRQAEGAMRLNRADGYLPKMITMLPANTIRIR